MTPIRSILAATDFSADATQACWRAAELAREQAAQLTLVHAIEPDALVALRDWLQAERDFGASVTEQGRIMLAAQADQLRKASQLQVREQVRTGARVAQIRDAAVGTDLLVLGAHGFHPMRNFVMGTTADRLVRSADTPVLVVKRPVAGPYRSGLVLTDFSAGAQAALQAALAIAPSATIHLLHAVDLPYEGRLRAVGVEEVDIARSRGQAREQALGRLESLRAGMDDAARLSVDVVHGDARFAAMARMDQLRPDFVALGKQGRSTFADVFLGSTTTWMLVEARCDVLVVPPAAAGAPASAAGGA